MKRLYKYQEGFTLIEILVGMAGVAAISVTIAGMVFNALSWQDRIRAEDKTNEGIRVFSRVLRQEVESALSVTSFGNEIRITGEDECFSFGWEQAGQRLNYQKVSGVGCAPADPAVSWFGPEVVVSNFAVTLRPLGTGGREVSVDLEISNNLPLGNFEKGLKITAVNLVD